MKGNMGQDKNEEPKDPKEDIMWSEADFRNEVKKRNDADDDAQKEPPASESVQTANNENEDDDGDGENEFDGYALRDAIYNKWGECFDLEFQPVMTFGFRELYLNVMPFRLGGKRFRHETELDYLCHLQAVVSCTTCRYMDV